MSEHTPGPWLAVSNRSNTAWSCICYKDGYTIATCNNVSVGDWEANARLIAAAPETAAERDKLKEVNAELLAALKRVDQSWTEWLPCGPYDESLTSGPIVRIDESTISIWKQIRAAIAKADGKS